MTTIAKPNQGVSPRNADRSRRLRSIVSSVGLAVVVALIAVSAYRFFAIGGDGSDARGGSPGVGATGGGSVADEIASLEATPAADRTASEWRDLSGLYVQRAAEIEDPTFYARSRNALASISGPDTTTFETNVAWAALELAAHQFPPALAYAQAAYAQRPTDADALAVLVDAEVENGLYAQAVQHADEWVALRADLASLSRQSYLRELYGDPEGGIVAMNQAVAAAQPGTAERATLEAYLGDQYFGIGDLEKAEIAYRASLATEPENLLGEVGLARIQGTTDQLEPAIDRLTAIAVDTPAPNVTGLLGELQLIAGQQDAAAKSFAKMAERYQLFEDSTADASLESAIEAANYGIPAEAVGHAERAYQGRQSVFTADAMGWALTRAGRASEAIPFVEESLALGTKSASFELHAAFAYDAAGDQGRAQGALLRSFEFNPWVYPGLRPETAALADRLGITHPW